MGPYCSSPSVQYDHLNSHQLGEVEIEFPLQDYQCRLSCVYFNGTFQFSVERFLNAEILEGLDLDNQSVVFLKVIPTRPHGLF